VDRGKCGTNVNLVCDNRAMPLGAAVAAANRQDCSSAAEALASLVVEPPGGGGGGHADPRALPTAIGDGNYAYAPTRAAARDVGFRLRAPARGERRTPGLGRVRVPVEHGHALLNQFGRLARRLDRSLRMFRMWVELAACLIYIRAGFVP
jgi:hypothetical protein